ncbi:hypothetical protein JW905_09365 [bacterium]|nr:hypothetical protein [candidate division CSSED10-310 bacterium]
MYYRCVLERGHVGAGKSVTTIWFERAMDMSSLLERLRRLPRLKGKSRLLGVHRIDPISAAEYQAGLLRKRSGMLI